MKSATKSAKAQRGFTLVELMMVLAILSIMATLGALGFREIVLNNQRESAVNFARNMVALARSEAIKRGRRVGICRHDPSVGGDAVPACDDNLATNDWDTNRWLFFLEVDGVPTASSASNAYCTPGTTPTADCAFGSHEPKKAAGRLVYNSGSANNYAFYITSTGQLGTYDGSSIFQDTTSVQFWFCDPREKGADNRLITIGPGSAKVRVASGTGNAQTPECVP